MKSNAEIKVMVDSVASELSMIGFALEHEVALRGEWEEAPVDTGLLYDTAARLQENIATLLSAAAQAKMRNDFTRQDAKG